MTFPLSGECSYQLSYAPEKVSILAIELAASTRRVFGTTRRRLRGFAQLGDGYDRLDLEFF